ncbi:MAG: threonine/serine exporter family protein [Mycobacterium leprae]
MLGALFAFITSASSAIAFRGPLRAVPASGLTGLSGYAAYTVSTQHGAPEMLAAFLGALVVGLAGELLARRLRQPTLLFVVPGLFPLVPGIIAYNGMLSLARNDLPNAAHQIARTMFYAGSLAAGLALPPAVLRRHRNGQSTIFSHRPQS